MYTEPLVLKTPLRICGKQLMIKIDGRDTLIVCTAHADHKGKTHFGYSTGKVLFQDDGTVAAPRE